MTASVVPAEWSDAFSPWSDQAPIQASTPMLKGADQLRRSLVPSLLEARRVNESLANPVIELFESARVYLPQDGDLPREQWTLSIASGGDYYHVKGAIEAIVSTLNPAARLEVVDTKQPLLDAAKSSELRIDGKLLGYLGGITEAALKQFGLRSPTTVTELSLSTLVDVAKLIPQHVDQSPYPAIDRDMNLIVDESVRWTALEDSVRRSAGDCLEAVSYLDTYRDPKKDGAGKKRLLLSITLRSNERTLTNKEADEIRENVVNACQKQHGAVLLSSA